MASLDSENFCDPFNKPISTNCRYFQLDVTAILILVSKHFSRLSSKNLQEYYSLSGQRHLSYQSDIYKEIPSHPSSLERKTLSFSKYSQDSPMQEHTLQGSHVRRPKALSIQESPDVHSSFYWSFQHHSYTNTQQRKMYMILLPEHIYLTNLCSLPCYKSK